MYKKSLIIPLLLITASVSQAGEIEERDEYDNRFSTLFMQEKFSDLDKQVEEYRVTKKRSSSGLFLLTHFYVGIKAAEEQNQDEQYWANIESSAHKLAASNPGILTQLSEEIAHAVKERARLDDKQWNILESKALKWAAQNPNSAAAHNVYAGLLVDHGGKIRGSGWSNEVRKEDWEPFHKKLAQASKYLLQNKRVASTDPEWYRLMLVIARDEGLERKEFDQLLKEAVSKYPYYYQIYFAALEYLLPKWHGSHEEVGKFINSTVERTKETEGMMMYARMYWVVADNGPDGPAYIQVPAVWVKVKAGMDEILTRYPDQWNINNFARMTCYAQDRDKGKELFGRIEGGPIPRAWGGDIGYYTICKNIMTGSHDPIIPKRPGV